MQRSCGSLQIEGTGNGSGVFAYTAEQCAVLQSIADPCGCRYQPCNVCGPNAMVTNPLATYGNEELIGGTGHCTAIEAIGAAGGWPPNVCAGLPADDLFLETCGCSGTFAPVATVPTSAPATPEPTTFPTFRPTPEPTGVPTFAPTPGKLKTKT